MPGRWMRRPYKTRVTVSQCDHVLCLLWELLGAVVHRLSKASSSVFSGFARGLRRGLGVPSASNPSSLFAPRRGRRRAPVRGWRRMVRVASALARMVRVAGRYPRASSFSRRCRGDRSSTSGLSVRGLPSSRTRELGGVTRRVNFTVWGFAAGAILAGSAAGLAASDAGLMGFGAGTEVAGGGSGAGLVSGGFGRSVSGWTTAAAVVGCRAGSGDRSAM